MFLKMGHPYCFARSCGRIISLLDTERRLRLISIRTDRLGEEGIAINYCIFSQLDGARRIGSYYERREPKRSTILLESGL